jgi:uncharacterized protein YwgA
MEECLERLNFFYRSIYGEDIDMRAGFDNRIKLQKLIYILQSEGIDLNYNFTWYIYGPYSSELTRDGYRITDEGKNISNSYHPKNNEENIISKMKKAENIFKNAEKAEIVASFRYLKDKEKYGDMTQKELEIRKPYTGSEIQQVAREWNELTNSVL